MLGFDVKKNFRYPYVARNITTFVRRFNSSVFAWFWDYICEPLWGGWLGTLVSGILMGLWYAGMWKIALGYLPCILADRGALCTAIFKEITTCAWTDLYMVFYSTWLGIFLR